MAERGRMSHKGTVAERKSDPSVCVLVCFQKRCLSHSLPLTRVLTEWQCVTIDQILLPCEHFYSLEEQ